MRFFIHTLGRTANQPTLIYLKAAGILPTLVVQPQEAEEYRAIYKGVNLWVLPERIKGLSATRQWIMENCQERYFALCDDDLRFSRKNPDDRTKLLNVDEQDMVDMIAAIRSKLQRFAHVGISARGGNNLRTDDYYLNERMMCFLCYDKSRIPPGARFDRVQCKQDFDMTLQLLEAGLPNCVLYEWAQDQIGGTNARGGCATYRTEEMADDAARALQRLHPKFVTLVKKSNSNWKGFTNEFRLEVKIAWKQAYAAGRKERKAV